MKIFFVFLIITSIAACRTKPFVKHDLEFEKVADNCNNQDAAFRMNSNLNGERFELQRCLDADFKKGQLTSYQPNDTTVVLKFERKNSSQALYQLTIDLDAYPRYSLLILDGDTIHMKQIEP
ncbi:MAG TPA: hypothetical protein VI461_09360 [Chitinophagaceae bacterium]|nr:hypothetical protein [Chitinophagaceae bacterium]